MITKKPNYFKTFITTFWHGIYIYAENLDKPLNLFLTIKIFNYDS